MAKIIVNEDDLVTIYFGLDGELSHRVAHGDEFNKDVKYSIEILEIDIDPPVEPPQGINWLPSHICASGADQFVPPIEKWDVINVPKSGINLTNKGQEDRALLLVLDDDYSGSIKISDCWYRRVDIAGGRLDGKDQNGFKIPQNGKMMNGHDFIRVSPHRDIGVQPTYNFYNMYINHGGDTGDVFDIGGEGKIPAYLFDNCVIRGTYYASADTTTGEANKGHADVLQPKRGKVIIHLSNTSIIHGGQILYVTPSDKYDKEYNGGYTVLSGYVQLFPLEDGRKWYNDNRLQRYVPVLHGPFDKVKHHTPIIVQEGAMIEVGLNSGDSQINDHYWQMFGVRNTNDPNHWVPNVPDPAKAANQVSHLDAVRIGSGASFQSRPFGTGIRNFGDKHARNGIVSDLETWVNTLEALK